MGGKKTVAVSRINSGKKRKSSTQARLGCRRVTPRYVTHVIICLNCSLNQRAELNGQSVKKKKECAVLRTVNLRCTDSTLY